MKISRKLKTNICEKRIKLVRIEAGMKQIDLAAALAEDHEIQVDQNSMSHIEKGDRFVKDYEIVALADVLSKSPLWLLYGDKVPQKFKS